MKNSERFEDCVDAGIEFLAFVLLIPFFLPVLIVAGIGWCAIQFTASIAWCALRIRRLTALEAERKK